jgi:hypothetical protein
MFRDNRATGQVRRYLPLTKKGRKIKRAMTKTYGKKKGAQVFFASVNAGKIKGAKKRQSKKK